MKRTQEAIILDYLKEIGGWKREYEIRCFRTPSGEWIGARGDRDVRSMISKGLLEASFDGKYRIVRWKNLVPFPLARKEHQEKMRQGTLTQNPL